MYPTYDKALIGFSMTSNGSDNAIANIGLSGNIITVTTQDSFEDKYNVLSYAVIMLHWSIL